MYTKTLHPTWRTVSPLLSVLGILLAILAVSSAPASVAPASDALAPLAPYVGKTWRGELSEPGSDAPKIDISQWEWALNGKAIRILHSINDGEYGGETLIFEDPEKGGLVFYYFTTAGFYTQGTVEIEDGKFVSHETVHATAEGVTEVRAMAEILPDGRLRSTSQYKRNGEWSEGHSAVYREAPGAKVVFRNP